ncbi:MAG: hypothetical protein IJH34_05910 [Romboutsia sp.]|nr:hypothetical protein [Romboutsia sp.]
MIETILTIWLLSYVCMIAIDYTPCDYSPKRAFIFITSLILGVVFILVLWAEPIQGVIK